jgi:hypothetical protein
MHAVAMRLGTGAGAGAGANHGYRNKKGDGAMGVIKHLHSAVMSSQQLIGQLPIRYREQLPI